MKEAVLIKKFTIVIVAIQVFILLLALFFNLVFDLEIQTRIISPTGNISYVLTGILSGALVWILLWLLGRIFPDFVEKIDSYILPLPLNKKNFLLLVFLPPVVEEIFFRGILQNLIGILPANILFALGHGGFRRELLGYNFLAFFLGIFLSILYKNTGFLLTPITAHLTINLLSSLRLLKLKQ